MEEDLLERQPPLLIADIGQDADDELLAADLEMGGVHPQVERFPGAFAQDARFLARVAALLGGKDRVGDAAVPAGSRGPAAQRLIAGMEAVEDLSRAQA